MKTEFKVGDRVAVYGLTLNANHCSMGSLDSCNKGTITETAGLGGCLRFKDANDCCEYWTNPKQCRKLIKIKSVRVTRKKLSEAWVESWSHDVHVFSDFCRRIGLPE